MELVDVFAGTWRVIESPETGFVGDEVTFFDDETGFFRLFGLAGSLQCRYSETVDGLVEVRFKWAGHDGAEKSARGSGWAVIRREEGVLEGVIRVIGGFERTFRAKVGQ